jgi:hypothetical protein
MSSLSPLTSIVYTAGPDTRLPPVIEHCLPQVTKLPEMGQICMQQGSIPGLYLRAQNAPEKA